MVSDVAPYADFTLQFSYRGLKLFFEGKTLDLSFVADNFDLKFEMEDLSQETSFVFIKGGVFGPQPKGCACFFLQVFSKLFHRQFVNLILVFLPDEKMFLITTFSWTTDTFIMRWSLYDVTFLQCWLLLTSKTHHLMYENHFFSRFLKVFLIMCLLDKKNL